MMQASATRSRVSKSWQKWSKKVICRKKFVRCVKSLMHGEKNGRVIGILSAIAHNAVKQMPNAKAS